MSAKFSYRPDIDAVRALAVVPVVGYHLGMRPLSGGYVGVDVFFVISGFLIARLIVNDVLDGSFSLASFYARRVRRLFPALFAMLAVTAAASAAILYPIDFEDFGSSLAAAAISLSNFFFWHTSDYFNADTSAKPLLHTWSLAVEEQYYLVFPMVILILARAGRRAISIGVAVLCLGSFLAAAHTVIQENAVSAFYLPHLRAWELLLGAVLAVASRPRIDSWLLRTIAAALGLGCVVVPVFLYDEHTAFPGLAALPPCLGAALLIAAGEDGRHGFSRIMSWHPIVFVGLISYSLYLWHWPIIVLYQQASADFLIAWPVKAVLAALSLLVAAASWRFIERPFRKRVDRPLPSLAFGGGGVALIMLVGALIVMGRGLPMRFDPDVLTLVSYMQTTEQGGEGGLDCYLPASERARFENFDRATCLAIDEDKTNVLVFGDSHALHLMSGMQSLAQDVNILQATASQCAPILDNRVRAARECLKLVDHVYDNVLADTRIDHVIISARWNRTDVENAARTFEHLSAYGDRVLIVGPSVQYHGSVPHLVAFARRTGDPEFADTRLVMNVPDIDEQMRVIAEAYGLAYFSAREVFCSSETDCRQLADNGAPFQTDYGHLSVEGSQFLVAELLADLEVEASRADAVR